MIKKIKNNKNGSMLVMVIVATGIFMMMLMGQIGLLFYNKN